MDIRIYKSGIWVDKKEELLATAKDLKTADIIMRALISEGMSCMAENENDDRVLDD